MPAPGGKLNPDAVGPSGFLKPGVKATEPTRAGEPMTQRDIDAVVQAFGAAAASAQRLGFDGIEIHGAHGYLLDQFFWEGTNQRNDAYGGDLVQRTRFAAELIGNIRGLVGPNFPICVRFSQWKLQDYTARLVQTPAELEQFLAPLVDAGVDLFHCSQRRFWEPEFEGRDLNLAGWTKKITGKPTITVGSVTLSQEFTRSFGTADIAAVTGIDELIARLERDEFDLVAVGRSLIVNPAWPEVVRRGEIEELLPFQREVLKELV